MNFKLSFFTLIVFITTTCQAQAIKPNVLLKKTEQALQNIKTVTYKINKKSNFFADNDTIESKVIVNRYLEPTDEVGGFHIITIKHDEKKYNQYKYDGIYNSFLYFNTDSLNVMKKVTVNDVKESNYNIVKGSFAARFLLQDYFKKKNIFKQYRSLLAKVFIKDITTEESIYNGTAVYVLTVYGKDKPKENRINSSVEKYYIRKSDFLPIAQSFYGEFQGMKETEFTEIDYLDINKPISLDTFKIDPSIKEVVPKAYYEQIEKYNL